MRSALRGPAHQLAVCMRINNCTHGRPAIIIAQSTSQPSHAPATALAPRVCTLVPFIYLVIVYATHCDFDLQADMDQINQS